MYDHPIGNRVFNVVIIIIKIFILKSKNYEKNEYHLHSVLLIALRNLRVFASYEKWV